MYLNSIILNWYKSINLNKLEVSITIHQYWGIEVAVFPASDISVQITKPFPTLENFPHAIGHSQSSLLKLGINT